MEEFWNWILGILEAFVIPDWGVLVSLIPLGLAGLIALWLGFTLYRFATLGPARRGRRRITPLPPSGVHMPGGSYAPILGAVGTGLLMGGLVTGGLLLWSGVLVLTLALLYWGREALREYDHLQPRTILPAVVHAGPPPGIHMPAPSFRPLLGAIGTTALLYGLVVLDTPQPADDQRPPLVLIVGAIILGWSLVGWLRDSRREYVETVRADQSGHLAALDAPGWPKRTLSAWLILLVVASLYQFGIVPPRPPASAAGPDASPSAGPSLPPGTLEVTAKTITYSVKKLTVDAGRPFAIQFRNDDPAGTNHDVDIRDAAGKTIIDDQPTIDGGTATLYQYTALEPGEYRYICSIHPIPTMTGTLTVR